MKSLDAFNTALPKYVMSCYERSINALEKGGASNHATIRLSNTIWENVSDGPSRPDIGNDRIQYVAQIYEVIYGGLL